MRNGATNAAQTMTQFVPVHQRVPNRQRPLSNLDTSMVKQAARTQTEFFKTESQQAVDQLQVGSKFSKNRVEPFVFTRFKQRAPSNYETELASAHKLIDNKQTGFQPRITHRCGEPGLPVSSTTVYR